MTRPETSRATPSSDDLATARAERDAAIAHARDLEMQLGVLRGQVKRLELIMWRRTARRQRWRLRLERVLAKVRRR